MEQGTDTTHVHGGDQTLPSEGFAPREWGELAQGSTLGRYLVIESVGRGGMGIVYRAYDPRLRREVALKVLARRKSPSQQQSLLQEAQAMAQLSHPNVLPVYDVEVRGGDAYIAMEFVEGSDLRTWLERSDHDWRARLELMQAAGRGLAAAHEAGLIHRDFKPGNVMVGDDGRVRVMDFGLARVAEVSPDEEGAASSSSLRGDSGSVPTHQSVVVGTPFYMAPEQHSGLRVDARCDQYAFCVALYEALYGHQPFAGRDMMHLVAQKSVRKVRPPEPSGPGRIPARIHRVILRGLSVHPDERFESMHALLEEVQAGSRRRWWGGLGAAAVLVGVGAWVLVREPAVDVLCEAQGDEVTRAWTPERREATRARFVATELDYAEATWQRVSDGVDRFTDAYDQQRQSICAAPAEAPDTALRRECLLSRRHDLLALLGVLDYADASAVEHAVEAVSRLPAVERCADPGALLGAIAPPPDEATAADVRRLRARAAHASACQQAGHYATGLEIAREVAAEADALGYEPLQAEVGLRLGSMLSTQGDYEEAEAALVEAHFAARTQGYDMLAGRTAAALTSVVGAKLARTPEGLLWGRHAQTELSRAGADDTTMAGLHSQRGTVYMEAGDFDAAVAAHRKALALREQALPADHPDVAASLNNLANALLRSGEASEALAMVRRAREALATTLGPDHPKVAATDNNLGAVLTRLGEYDEAEQHHRRALELRQRVLGPNHPAVASSLNNLAIVYRSQGRQKEALAYYRQAYEVSETALGPDHPKVAALLHNIGNLLQQQGKLDEARIDYLRALEIRRRVLDPNHPELAASYNNLGTLSRQSGQLQAAIDYHRDALRVAVEAVGEEHPLAASSRAKLALALRAYGRPEEALSELQTALRVRRVALGPEHPLVSATLYELGLTHLALGTSEEALAALREAVELRRRRPQPLEELVEAELALVDAERAAGNDLAVRALIEQVRERCPAGSPCADRVTARLAPLP